MAITNLKTWRNGETFTARDYMYERNLITAEIENLKQLLGEGGIFNVDALEIGDATLSWNDTDGTVDIAYNGVTLQLGQEQHFYGKAYQSNITNGDPVMFAGVEGNHFRLQVATPEVINTTPELFMGIATQDIATGEFGYVTMFGFVRDIDIELAEGSIAWFDPINGGLTSTKPDRGYAQIRVAAVTTEKQNQNQLATIFVRIDILEGGAADGVALFTTDDEPTNQLTGDIWFDNN